jgi:hypothetical protein
VVKPPDMVLTPDDRLLWPLPETDRSAGVSVRRSDRKIALNGVPALLDSAEVAIAVGAALVAAGKHVQEKTDG